MENRYTVVRMITLMKAHTRAHCIMEVGTPALKSLPLPKKDWVTAFWVIMMRRQMPAIRITAELMVRDFLPSSLEVSARTMETTLSRIAMSAV